MCHILVVRLNVGYSRNSIVAGNNKTDPTQVMRFNIIEQEQEITLLVRQQSSSSANAWFVRHYITISGNIYQSIYQSIKSSINSL